MDNRIFFKKWGDYNPLEPFSLDVIEMNAIIKMLEKIPHYFQDEEIHARIGCSSQEIIELKSKLEILLSEENI
ncbi:MAG: hypothetical protein JO129_03305 [Candidatus Dependentiae bacterium]|nr:hypothetical protein [Candidatus Dependentiae bacterium]